MTLACAPSLQGDLELVDKIIELEGKPESPEPSTSQNPGGLFGTAALLPFNPFSSSSSSSGTAMFGGPRSNSTNRPKPVRGGRAQVLASRGHAPRMQAPKRLKQGPKSALHPPSLPQSKQVRIKSPPAATPLRRSPRIATGSPTVTTTATSHKRPAASQDQQPSPAKKPRTTQSSEQATKQKKGGKGKAGRPARRAAGRKAAGKVMRGGKKVMGSSKAAKQVKSKQSGRKARRK